jgi:hypothetical protein
MSPVLGPTSKASHVPGVTDLDHGDLRDESSSNGTTSSSLINVEASSPSSTSSTSSTSIDPPSPPQPTRPIKINEKDTGYEYVTLSVTLPYTTYITTVLLGDSSPTTNGLVPTTYPVPASSSSSNTKVQTPGIANGTIVGIVVGLVVGFLALFAVFYVYLLRARQAKRRRRRRRSRRGSPATAEGESDFLFYSVLAS